MLGIKVAARNKPMERFRVNEQKCPPLNIELPKLLNEVAYNKGQMKPCLQQEVVPK